MKESDLGLRKISKLQWKGGKLPSFPKLEDLHGPKYIPGRAQIYGLVDPTDRTLRYVGKTLKPLDQRLAEHIKHPTNEHTRTWIRVLAIKGLRPEIVLLTTCNEAKWELAETGWIVYAARRGRLYNIDPGGVVRGKDGELTRKGAWKRATFDKHRAQKESGKSIWKLRRQRNEFFAAVKDGSIRVWTPEEIAAREAEVKQGSRRLVQPALNGKGATL